MERFEDRLELVGIAFGAFVVLVGLGTLAGQPWTRTTSTLTALGQVVGALLSIGIGGGLIWLSRTGTESPVTEPEPETPDEGESTDADAA